MKSSYTTPEGKVIGSVLTLTYLRRDFLTATSHKRYKLCESSSRHLASNGKIWERKENIGIYTLKKMFTLKKG